MPSPPAEPPATAAPRAPSPRWSLAPSELDGGESSPSPAPALEPPLERDELVDDIDELLSELEISSAGWNGSDPSIDSLDHRRLSLKITHYPDDYAEPSPPVDILPLSPPATDTTACLAAPMTYAFPATWYSHPDMPGVWVCAGCFGRHLAGTKFDPQFDGRAYNDGRPRACWFGGDRVVYELLPRALATGFLQPLIDHLNEVATPRAA
ncbi:hypothetical protein VdG1_07437 [Verticillium dahliae VDG1]|nr:hypothetical protein VdG1_07437 [Verticillium dahliae VDG1]